MMDIGNTLYVRDRRAWRKWLEANFNTEKEIWLIYPTKGSGKPRIQYNDAVEEALSFGWIDSTVKRVDENSSAQRFSPRNPDSEYSQANKERLKWLVKEGRIHLSIQESVEKALKPDFVFPKDKVVVFVDGCFWHGHTCLKPRDSLKKGFWKEKIERISKGDVVFLYQSGVGIVAVGVATGNLKKRPYEGHPDEDYSMPLAKFEVMTNPMPAWEIKQLCGVNYRFMSTLFSIDAEAGRKLEAALRSRNKKK